VIYRGYCQKSKTGGSATSHRSLYWVGYPKI